MYDFMYMYNVHVQGTLHAVIGMRVMYMYMYTCYKCIYVLWREGEKREGGREREREGGREREREGGRVGKVTHSLHDKAESWELTGAITDELVTQYTRKHLLQSDGLEPCECTPLHEKE